VAVLCTGSNRVAARARGAQVANEGLLVCSGRRQIDHAHTERAYTDRDTIEVFAPVSPLLQEDIELVCAATATTLCDRIGSDKNAEFKVIAPRVLNSTVAVRVRRTLTPDHPSSKRLVFSSRRISGGVDRTAVEVVLAGGPTFGPVPGDRHGSVARR